MTILFLDYSAFSQLSFVFTRMVSQILPVNRFHRKIQGGLLCFAPHWKGEWCGQEPNGLAARQSVDP